MSNMRHSNQLRRGQALVECSLIMILLLGLLIGTVDFGQVMYFHQGLAMRARIGAQWAAVNTFDSAKIANMVVYGVDTPTNSNRPLISGLSTANVAASLSNANTTNSLVEVRIQNYQFRFFSPWIASAHTSRPIVARMSHEPTLP
jgi:Flp pilus assembly protein TadG